MSEHSPEPAAPGPDPSTPHTSGHRPGHVKVRKRIRVVTAEGLRSRRQKQWKKVQTAALYAGLILASLAAIWIGLKMFVKDPPMPQSNNAVDLPVSRLA